MCCPPRRALEAQGTGDETTRSRMQYPWALWGKHLCQTPPAQSPVTTGQCLNSSSWPRGLPQPSPSPSLQPHPLQLPLRCPCCHHTCLLILLWAHLSFQDPVLSTQALCPLCPETLCSAQFNKEVGQVLTGVFQCQGDKAA